MIEIYRDSYKDQNRTKKRYYQNVGKPTTILDKDSPILDTLAKMAQSSVTFPSKPTHVAKVKDTTISMLDPDFQMQCNVVDFANKHIGGGVFGRGSVQEEIMMICSPDLLVAKYLCDESLTDNDAVWVIGAPPVSRYIGYSRTFQYNGPVDPKAYHDPTTMHNVGSVSFSSESTTRYIAVLPYVTCIMDALDFDDRGDIPLQITGGNFVRELTKAIAAFLPPSDQFIEMMLEEEQLKGKRRYFSAGDLKQHTQFLWLPFELSEGCPRPGDQFSSSYYPSAASRTDPLFFYPNSKYDVFIKEQRKSLTSRSSASRSSKPKPSPFLSLPGVSSLLNRRMMSGLWGCGAFNGDPIVKGIIQICAMRFVHFIIAIQKLHLSPQDPRKGRGKMGAIAESGRIGHDDYHDSQDHVLESLGCIPEKPRLVLCPYKSKRVHEKWVDICVDVAEMSIIDIWKIINRLAPDSDENICDLILAKSPGIRGEKYRKSLAEKEKKRREKKERKQRKAAIFEKEYHDVQRRELDSAIEVADKEEVSIRSKRERDQIKALMTMDGAEMNASIDIKRIQRKKKEDKEKKERAIQEERKKEREKGCNI
ncbi:Poly(ADP-ribose) glycohydrolase like protein [Aduncisulcus paluster]|uniref:Poly(ADP-ribose) glycohydrolase like protein n=1 Tax=Aduncisulcus paluster TaxID=2918883 RepID=A0ABQ5K1T7_9EUKA|nr:Poly(ADP-ribose) glycohydrolase like protein [Aduncisulcus paluster]